MVIHTYMILTLFLFVFTLFSFNRVALVGFVSKGSSLNCSLRVPFSQVIFPPQIKNEEYGE